jgi:hypothetical protein
MTDEQARAKAAAEARRKHADKAQGQEQWVQKMADEQAQWALDMPDAEAVAADAWNADLADLEKAARTFEVGSLRSRQRDRYAQGAAHLLQVLQAKATQEAAAVNRSLAHATWVLVAVTAVLAAAAVLALLLAHA